MSVLARTLTIKMSDATTQVVSLPANDLRAPDDITRDLYLRGGIWISDPKGDKVGAIWCCVNQIVTVTIS